ncbi:LppA family lipoprotein [Herbiconiux sp. P18]|uniref:LppA family lipoprotein n=1 Tax=Herbiconiux liangxiaofengii TaxID=3342795 RepID=UPI0035B75324
MTLPGEGGAPAADGPASEAGAGTPAAADAAPDATAEEAAARLDTMLAELQDALASAVPGGEWTVDGSTQVLGGSERDGVETAIAVSGIATYDQPMPTDDGDRAAVLAALDAVAGRYGFSALQVFVQRSDEVQATADDAAGNQYSLGSRVFTTLSYTTVELPDP